MLVAELLAYYAANARDLEWRHNPTPYRVWISEIMLQQTRVEAVREYYRRFLEEVPDVETLAALPEERLFKLWEGLGYYSRARNLQKAARVIAERGRFPDTREEIAELPGIGPYTAGAISSIAFGLPEPAVDGNVLRVLSRMRGENMLRDAAAAYLKPLYPAGKCSAFTQSLMELGATVCLPNGKPLCGICPLKPECVALRDGRIDELPEKPKKTARKIERKTVLLLEYDGRFAVTKRGSRGLLAGLWGFPEIGETDDPAAFLASAGGMVSQLEKLPDSKHIFTHIEWRMHHFHAVLKTPPDELNYVWATAAELRSDFAIPSAYRMLLRFLPR